MRLRWRGSTPGSVAPGLPGRDELHLWRLPLDRTGADLAHCRRWLSPREEARAARLRIPAAARRFVASRGLLRLLLGRLLELPPGRVPLTVGTHGKPGVAREANPAGLTFNLARSGDLALVVVGRRTPVGVDLERCLPRALPDRLLERVLSPAERRALDAGPPERRLHAFYRYWSRKEAVLKAVGMGLRIPPAVVEAPDMGPPLRLRWRGREVWTQVADLAPGAGTVGAVAWEAARPGPAGGYSWERNSASSCRACFGSSSAM